MSDTLTCRCAPPDDAIADELDTLRAQRTHLIAALRAERRDGATVTRIGHVLHLLGVRR